MIEKDIPITTIEQDILGRTRFAKKVADIIVEENSFAQNGFVIGIQGPWGCGKTSLCNLIKGHLSMLGKESKPEICEFNAWMFQNKDKLIASFFTQLLKNTLNVKGGLSKKDIVDYLRGLLSTSELSLGICDNKFTLKPFYNIVDKSVKKQKEEIAHQIKRLNHKIVFFIDDIDRLTDSEIATIFWLVKNIADFPNVIYVLCYDAAVVSSALDKVQQSSGLAYIEKIIQFPINVPMPSKEKIYKYFFDKLEKICVKNDESVVIDWEYIFSLYHAGIRDVLLTVRDCNRLLNAFSFKYDLCKNEVDIGDLLVITAFELYVNEVYELLRKNMSALNKKSYYETPLSKEDAKRFANDIDDVVDRYKRNREDLKFEKETIHSLVGTLFPKFAETVKWFGLDNSKYNPQQMHRVQCEQYFYRYFELGIDENDISSERIYNFLYNDDLQTMQDFLRQCIEQGKASSLFRQLADGFSVKNDTDIWKNLSISRVETFLVVLLKVDSFSKEKNEFISTESYWFGSLIKFLQYMSRNFEGEDKEISKCLETVISDESICFSNISKLVLEVYMGYKYPNNIEHHYTTWESYVSDAIRASVEKVFKERLSICLSNDDIINEDVSWRMIEMWHAFDMELFEQFILRDRPVAALIKILKWFLAVDKSHEDNVEWSMANMYQSEQTLQQLVHKLSAWQKSKEYECLPRDQKLDIEAMIILLDKRYSDILKASFWDNNKKVVTEDIIRQAGFVN